VSDEVDFDVSPWEIGCYYRPTSEWWFEHARFVTFDPSDPTERSAVDRDTVFFCATRFKRLVGLGYPTHTRNALPFTIARYVRLVYFDARFPDDRQLRHLDVWVRDRPEPLKLFRKESSPLVILALCEQGLVP
jgi:hypothetical protein